MANPIYTSNKFRVNSEQELLSKVFAISKQYPDLVFIATGIFGKFVAQGYKSRSAIPFSDYESHLRDIDGFIQNGKIIAPTKSQLQRVNKFNNNCYMS